MRERIVREHKVGTIGDASDVNELQNQTTLADKTVTRQKTLAGSSLMMPSPNRAHGRVWQGCNQRVFVRCECHSFLYLRLGRLDCDV